MSINIYVFGDVCYTDLDDAVQYICDNHTITSHSSFTIDVHTRVDFWHKDFVNTHHIIEQMQCHAYDESPEYSDGYLDDIALNPDKVSELNMLLVNWFNNNAHQPRFYNAGKLIESIEITMDWLDHNGYEYEF